MRKKPVYAYNLKGELLKIYDSMLAVQKKYPSYNIHDYIKRESPVKNRFFSHENLDKREVIELVNKYKVYVYNSDGFLGLFNRNEIPDFKPECINVVLNKRTLKGHFFSSKPLPGYKVKKKQVIQKDLNGDIIKIYNSVKQASEENQIPQSNISMNLTGKTKTGAGFFWEYSL